MGGFTLLKIKRWKGSLLRGRTRSATSVPPSAPGTCSAGPDEDDDASITITYEASCSDGGSTLSSIHTDSLTSFAGNLSPPEIELLDDFYRVVVSPNWSMGGLGRGARARMRGQREERQEESGPEREEKRQEGEPGVAVDGDGGRRDSPAASRCSTGPTSSQRSSKSNSLSKEEGLEYSLSSLLASPPKSKSEDLAPPSKPKVAINPAATASNTTLRTTIVGPSLPLTSVPSVVSHLLEDFHPTAEVGWEINDEGNTVATQEVLEGLLPLQREVAVGTCDFASSALAVPFACLQACRGEAAGTACAAADTVSMFDDEGNRHRLARTPTGASPRREVQHGVGDLASAAGGSAMTPDSTAATMLEVYGADGSEPESGVGRGRAARGPTAVDRTDRSDQVGREIAVEKRYRAGGCVMKHLNNLYDAHRKGQATGAVGRGGIDQARSWTADMVRGGSLAPRQPGRPNDPHDARRRGQTSADGEGKIDQARSWTGDAARDGCRGAGGRGPLPRRHEGRRSRSAGERPLLPSLPEGAGGR